MTSTSLFFTLVISGKKICKLDTEKKKHICWLLFIKKISVEETDSGGRN